MSWTDIASKFEWDGSLRDIYVFGATTNDWQRVLDALRERQPAPSFFVDGEAVPLPERVEDVLVRRQSASPLLVLKLGQIQLNCHFFDHEEIEFDLDPREVKGQAEFEAVSAFMKLLAGTTGKTAFLTHENTRSAVILAVSSA